MSVLNAEFGIRNNWWDFIDEQFKLLPKLNSVDAQIVLQELYEIKYGIFNHSAYSKIRPLSSVAFHNSEDFSRGGRLDILCKAYIDKNIREMYGLNFIEFLNNPFPVNQILMMNAEEEMRRKSQRVSSVQAEIENTLKNNGMK